MKDVRESLLSTWRTNDRVNAELIAQLTAALWKVEVPGIPRRTIRAIAAHLHNARCRWIRTLGEPHGIAVPPRVDPHRVTQRQLIAALKRSRDGIEAILELGIANGGEVPATKRYVWRNLALDVVSVLTYFIAHEAHHRGQIVMIARQSGQPLPRSVAGALWWWKER